MQSRPLHVKSNGPVKILLTAHVRSSITGKYTVGGQSNLAAAVRSKLVDLVYTSMINTMVPTLMPSTTDIGEFIRLSRMLWPIYLSPLDKCKDNDSIHKTMWSILRDHWEEMRTNEETESGCAFIQKIASLAKNDGDGAQPESKSKRLTELLGLQSREMMREILSKAAAMPGRALQGRRRDVDVVPYAARLPYTTKFLLLAAYLCQQKRNDQDYINLFTSHNTGRRRGGKKPDGQDGSAFAASSIELKQRQHTFPMERMISVFHAIISQYGDANRSGPTAELGTGILFRKTSELVAARLLNPFGRSHSDDALDLPSAKFVCTLSKEDAEVIAAAVGFPLVKYC